MYRVQIYVYLKKSVADPQGMTIKRALDSLGYQQVEDVRVGKYLDLKIEQDGSEEDVRKAVQGMCEKLLVNPVIEDYRLELEKCDA